MGRYNQTWGAIWVWGQSLISRQFTGIQGDALKRKRGKFI